MQVWFGTQYPTQHSCLQGPLLCRWPKTAQRHSVLGQLICSRRHLRQDRIVTSAVSQGGPSVQPQRRPEQVPVQRPRARQTPRPTNPEFGTLLRRCQVVNKPVISCTSGKQLGLVSHFMVDPTQLTVASLAVRPKGFNQSASGYVDLSTVVQIGDVVLVSKDMAPGSSRLSQHRGCVRLGGSEVFTYGGVPLGKVRNFAFRPDTGRITSVQYDELGMSNIPESWVMLWEVGVEHVHDVEAGRLTLRQRSERAPLLLQEGALGRLIAGAVSLRFWPPWGEGSEGALEADASYLAWAAQNQDEYERFYGQAIPTSREEYDAFMMGYKAANGVPTPARVPLPLPEPRQGGLSAFEDRIAATPLRQRELERLPVLSTPASRDPRLRQRTVDISTANPTSDWNTRPRRVTPSYSDPRGGPLLNTPTPLENPRRYSDSPRGGPDNPPNYRGGTSAPPPQGANPQTGTPAGWGSEEQPGWQGVGNGGSSWGERSGESSRGQKQSSSTIASVPIMDMRTMPPHRRRDVDGNYGEAPAQANSLSSAKPSVSFKEWAVDDTKQDGPQQPMSDAVDANGGRSRGLKLM